MAKRKEDPRTYRVRAWKRQGIDITWERYQAMVEEQDNRCAICNRKARTKALSVDHNHKTGQVRGLLCAYCNSKVLKYLRDDSRTAAGLVRYLRRWFVVEETT